MRPDHKQFGISGTGDMLSTARLESNAALKKKAPPRHIYDAPCPRSHAFNYRTAAYFLLAAHLP